MEIMRSVGRPMTVDSRTIKENMIHAGLVDVKEETIQVAINGWPSSEREREVGRWFNLALASGLPALSLAPFSRVRGMTLDEINAMVASVTEEIRSRRIHAYCTL